MGEEIREGDWERFSELDRELTAYRAAPRETAREGAGTA
jgi:hypothetical protein